MEENNGTVNTNGTPANAGTQQGAPEQNVQQPQPVPVTPQPQTAQQPQTEPGWWKRNWKKVVGIASGVVAVTASARAAFVKGKQAGAAEMQAQIPQQQGYDPSEYALNPNVDE